MKTKGLLWALMLMALLTACSDEKAYRIGVSQCGGGQWREKVNQEMLAAQHLYEHDVKISVACAHDNSQRQIEQIDSLVASGIDLLVVAPNEAAAIGEAISRAKGKGIPVIFFDRKAETEDYTAFIGGSNTVAGEACGIYALLLAQQVERHKPVIVEVTGAMSTSPAQERHRGFAQTMKGHDEVIYLSENGDWTEEGTRRIVKKLLAEGPRPDIVFCHNDGMAEDGYKVVAEDSSFIPKIIGIDGLPGEGIAYVQQGHQVGTYIYPTHGEKIVRLALDILTGKPYERENMLQGMMVTPENVNIVDLNSRELMKQNHDLVTIQDKLENSLVLYDTQKKMLMASLVCIVVLAIAVVLAVRAWWQTKKTIRQRQAMNEEQTLFYTDPSSRKLHQAFITPEEALPTPKSQDVLFAEQLNEAIRKNMSNPNLKMDDLGEELGLGRVQLYRKVKAITGQTPVELLRQMRLQRAYALLGNTTKTVAEIAFEVGFNTPGYFSKCFKEQYGKLPGALRANEESE